MTNNQAFQAGNYCDLLFNSKNISFGVASRLKTNSKNYTSISEQFKELKKVGKEKEYSEEEIKKELTDFGNAEFEGTFKQIDLANVENLPYEEIPVITNNAQGEQVNTFFIVRDMLYYLQELNIIQ